MTATWRLLALSPVLALASCFGPGGGHALDEAPVALLPPETVPTPEELVGVWKSARLSGGLDEVARAFVYAFRSDGGYSAAVLVDQGRDYEWLTLAGEYAYEDGELDLGPGAPTFTVRRQGPLLRFTGDEGGLLLTPFLDDGAPASVPPTPPTDAGGASS